MKLRLVILDNVKAQIDNPFVQKIFSDMLFVKQSNFLRSDSQYVVMDKHDMVGTHYLIYDISSFMQPKLVSAIRTTYKDRAELHKLDIPLMSLLNSFGEIGKEKFEHFLMQHSRLVDCNGWFVDSQYTSKINGATLPDVLLLVVVLNLIRQGYDNMVGVTNETYKASRWFHPLGRSSEDIYFTHPLVPVIHKLIMIDQFDLKRLHEKFLAYEDLLKDLEEIHKDSESQKLYDFALGLFKSLELEKDVA